MVNFVVLSCLYFSCFVSSFRFDRLQPSRSRVIFSRSTNPQYSNHRFSLYSEPENEAKSTEAEEASIKKESIYEARSKLLEAALLSLRARQTQSDITNKALFKEVSELNLKNDLADKENTQLAAELMEVKSEIYTVLSGSKATMMQLEKDQQQKTKNSISEIEKYKNRLMLIENAYRESQVSMKDMKEKFRQKNSEDISQFEAEIEIERQNHGADMIMSQNSLLTARKEIAVMKESLKAKDEEFLTVERLWQEESKRVIIFKEKILELKDMNDKMKEVYIIELESEKMVRENVEKGIEKMVKEGIEKKEKEIKDTVKSETFSEFFTEKQKKEKLRLLEQQLNDQQQQLALQQELILAETAKLLAVANEQKISISTPDPQLAADLKEQSRLIEKQTNLLESLLGKLSQSNSSLSISMNSMTEAVLIDLDSRKISDSRNRDDRDVYRDRISDDRNDYLQNIKDIRDDLRAENEERLRNNAETRLLTAQMKSSVKRAFSKLVKIVGNVVAQPIDSNKIGEDKKKVADLDSVIDNRLQQEKRVELARKSGRIIRGMGGVLAKSAVDTIGFWVGLGFDDEDEENNRNSKRSSKDSNKDDDNGYDDSYSSRDDFNYRNYENRRISSSNPSNNIDKSSKNNSGADYDDYIDGFGGWTDGEVDSNIDNLNALKSKNNEDRSSDLDITQNPKLNSIRNDSKISERNTDNNELD